METIWTHMEIIWIHMESINSLSNLPAVSVPPWISSNNTLPLANMCSRSFFCSGIKALPAVPVLPQGLFSGKNSLLDPCIGQKHPRRVSRVPGGSAQVAIPGGGALMGARVPAEGPGPRILVIYVYIYIYIYVWIPFQGTRSNKAL